MLFRIYRIEDPNSATDRVRRARNSSSSGSISSSSSRCGTSDNSSSIRISSSNSVSISNISSRRSYFLPPAMEADHVCFCDRLPASVTGLSRTLPASSCQRQHFEPASLRGP